ncbi:MAG: WbqC family protein [Bacteroidota bacterium]
MSALFSTSYLPSVEYLKLISEQDEVIIDLHDKWKKKTARNRCFILSPNGVQCLSIPVNSKHSSNTTSEVKIDYAQPWIRIHKGALEAAYNTAPFFEFIKDDIWAIFDNQPETLLDLNNQFLRLLLKKLKLSVTLSIEIPTQSNLHDFRKLSDNHGYSPSILNLETFKPYNQVFSYKHPFSPNLSALDFLANNGSSFKGW